MVGVEVGQDQQRDPDDAQGAQTAVHGPWLGAGVHHDRRSRPGRQDQCVPLPDITGHQPPTGRWPAGDDPGQRRRADDGQQQDQRAHRAQPPAAQHRAAHQDRGHRGQGQQQGAGPAARPVQLRAGQGRAPPGHLGDPLRGPSGRVSDPSGERRGQRGHGERGEPQDGGRADRRLGQQIAGDPHQAHPLGEHHHDRGAHRLGGRGRRQHLRPARRHTTAAQRRGPHRGEGEQRAGGQDGERETVTPRQPGVVEHQRQNGGGQGGQQRSAPSGAEGEQRDQPARRCAQHTGLGTAHDHEAQGERAAERGCRPQPQPERGRQPPPLGPCGEPGRSGQQGEDERQIAAGDRHQMQQIRGPERFVEIGRHPRGVPHDQPRQQRPRVRGEPVRGAPQPLAQPSRPLLECARGAGHPRRPAAVDPHHGRDPVPVTQRRRQTAVHPQPGRGQQREPARPLPRGARPDRHQHRSAGGGRGAVGSGDPADLRLDHHRHRRGSGTPHPGAGEPGVGGDLHLGGDPGVLPGQLRDRAVPHLGRVQRGDRPRRGTAQQCRGHRARHAPVPPGRALPGVGAPPPGTGAGRAAAGPEQQHARHEAGHGAAHRDGPARCAQGDARGGPGREGRWHQAEVRRSLLAGLGRPAR